MRRKQAAVEVVDTALLESPSNTAVQTFEPAEVLRRIEGLEAVARIAARLGDITMLEEAVTQKVQEQVDFARHVRPLFRHGGWDGKRPQDDRSVVLRNTDDSSFIHVSAQPQRLTDYCEQFGLTARQVQRWYRLADDEDFQKAEVSRRVEKARRAALDEKTAHVSHNAGENEWYTPQPYIDAARAVLGRIDLDPASTPVANDVVRAARFFTVEDDGLAQPWEGRVWLNPPYAQPLIGLFARKLADEVGAGRTSQAIVLVNNATETEWFCTLAACAAALCFPRGRVTFWHPDRTSTPLQGQAILYIGTAAESFGDAFAAFGHVWAKM